MPRPASLLGDQVVCTPVCPFPPVGPYIPPGTIVAVIPSAFFVNGRPLVRIGDTIVCGGPSATTTGAYCFIVRGVPAHRLADMNACVGATVGPGAPNFIIGD